MFMKAESHCNVSQAGLLPGIKHEYSNTVVLPATKKLIQI